MPKLANKTVRLWQCLRCNHIWANRKDQKPHICPSCKSYLWDIPKSDKDGV